MLQNLAKLKHQQKNLEITISGNLYPYPCLMRSVPALYNVPGIEEPVY